MNLDLPTAVRLAVLYAHLLLCVFALHQVLSADVRVLARRITPVDVALAHRRLIVLLAGLWISGAAIVAIDMNLDATGLFDRPKLVAKLTTVMVLTLNGLVLRWYSLPRVLSRKPMQLPEFMLVMLSGALSTSSWLMAAFYGIARPLQRFSIVQCLEIYVAVLCCAGCAALLLAMSLRRRFGVGVGVDLPPAASANGSASVAADWPATAA